MLKKTTAYILFILSVLASACSPAEMFTLTPDRKKVETEEGTEIAFLEDDFVFSNIEFEEEAEGNFIFYVFVFNKSGEKISIDPTQIKMIAFNENKEPLEGFNTFYGKEPRLMTGKMNEGIKNRKTEHDVSTGLNFLFALISTVADLSDNKNNNAGAVVENVVVFAENQVHEELDFSNDVQYLESGKECGSMMF